MADHYLHDDEEAEKVKRWLRENGMSLVVGIALGIAAILGWQWWNANQRAYAETASMSYQYLLQAIQQQDEDAVSSRGETLLEEFDGSPYATLGALVLAKQRVEASDLEGAARYLQWTIDHTDQAQSRQIARLRLARVRLAQEQPQEALALLDQVDDDNFQAEVAELRGDVHLALDQPDQARQAYQVARAGQEPGMPTALLDIKLDNLAARED